MNTDLEDMRRITKQCIKCKREASLFIDSYRPVEERLQDCEYTEYIYLVCPCGAFIEFHIPVN